MDKVDHNDELQKIVKESEKCLIVIRVSFF